MNANLGLLNTEMEAAEHLQRRYCNWFVLLMLDTPRNLEKVLDEMCLGLDPAREV
jgi:hypothetical protein